MEPVNDTAPAAQEPKTIGQVAHEAAVAAGAAEGEFHTLEDDMKADLEKFGKIIEAVVHHIFSKPVTLTTTPAPATASTAAGNTTQAGS
jgi:hypothetical protein